MELALVLARSEGELLCDLLEVYHILDYRALSPVMVATLFCGLRDDSRSKMAISGQKHSFDRLLLARLVDDVAFIAWTHTKDAEKNKNRPKPILQELLGIENAEKCESFHTADDFNKRWKELTGG